MNIKMIKVRTMNREKDNNTEEWQDKISRMVSIRPVSVREAYDLSEKAIALIEAEKLKSFELGRRYEQYTPYPELTEEKDNNTEELRKKLNLSVKRFDSPKTLEYILDFIEAEKLKSREEMAKEIEDKINEEIKSGNIRIDFNSKGKNNEGKDNKDK